MRIPTGPLWDGAKVEDDDLDEDELEDDFDGSLEEGFPDIDPIAPLVPGFYD